MNSFSSPPRKAAWKAIKVVWRQTFYTSWLHQLHPTNKRKDFYSAFAFWPRIVSSETFFRPFDAFARFLAERKIFTDASRWLGSQYSWRLIRIVLDFRNEIELTVSPLSELIPILRGQKAATTTSLVNSFILWRLDSIMVYCFIYSVFVSRIQ